MEFYSGVSLHTWAVLVEIMLGLAMRAEYFGGLLTWWFSPLGSIILLSHCESYKMDKVTIYCHGFLFHMGFSC